MERLTNDTLTEGDVIGGAVNRNGGGLLAHSVLSHRHIKLHVRVVERAVASESVHTLINGKDKLSALNLRVTDLLGRAIKSGGLQLNAGQVRRNL